MGPSYFILGCGKQGVAAAYDLLRHGAAKVTLADAALSPAKEAARRLKALLPGAKAVIAPKAVDARSAAALVRALRGHQAVLSALPYYLNPTAARAAVAAKVHYVDLGGHFETTRKINMIHKSAFKAGVSLIPDCGISPGTCNVLAAAGISRMEKPEEVHIYCGGLPQNPRPPLGYKIVFNLEGVIGNYLGEATVLRDGGIARDAPLSRRQILEFDGLGRLEAAVTGGATATAPWTYQGRLRAYDYKTLRYPGHWDRIETLRDLGLFEEAPVLVDGRRVSPRKVFVACAEGRLRFPDDRDLLVQRVIVTGTTDGRPARATYDLLDYFDPATGFTAMQRTTGFSAAAVLAMAAAGRIASPGVVPVETAVPPLPFIEELRARGIAVKETLA